MTQKTYRPRDILRKRNRRLFATTIIIALIIAGYIAYEGYFGKGWVATDDAFVAGHLVTVKAQTEGTVVEILAENTQFVREGQLLVRLDGVQAEIAFHRAQAELADAVRTIAALTLQTDTLGHRIAAKQAELNLIDHNLRRFLNAMKEGAVSAQEVQNAKDKIAELNASIKALETERAGLRAQVDGITLEEHPVVEKAKSQVRSSFIAYRRSGVLAPVSGWVAKRRVQIGDPVKESAPLLVIVPLDDVWIDANYLESQTADIRTGQAAEITTDLYGSHIVFHGKVEGINPATGSSFALLPADYSTGNFIHVAERVPVRIRLQADELKQHPLRLGLSTVTRIHTLQTGGEPLASTAGTEGEAYRTTVFQDELNGVESLIRKIISDNKPAIKYH